MLLFWNAIGSTFITTGNLTVVLRSRPLSQNTTVSIFASLWWHLTSFPENCSRGWMPRSRMSRSRILNWVQFVPSRPHPKNVATRPPSCQPNWPADLTSMRATPLRDSTASLTLTLSLRSSPVNRLKTWRRCSKGETCLVAVVGIGIGSPEIYALLLTWWRWHSVWSTQALPTRTMSSYPRCLCVETRSIRPKLAGCAAPAGLAIISWNGQAFNQSVVIGCVSDKNVDANQWDAHPAGSCPPIVKSKNPGFFTITIYLLGYFMTLTLL